MKPEKDFFALKIILLDVHNEVARQTWNERYLEKNKKKIIKEQKEKFSKKKEQLFEGLQREGFVVKESSSYVDSDFFHSSVQDAEFSVKLQLSGSTDSNSFNPQQDIKTKIQNELLMKGFDSPTNLQVNISKNKSASSYFESFPTSSMYSHAHTYNPQNPDSDSDDELNEFNLNLNSPSPFHSRGTNFHDTRLPFTANVTATISTFRHPEFLLVKDHVSYMNSQQAEYGELMRNVAVIISQCGYSAKCTKWSREKEGSNFEIQIPFTTDDGITQKECVEFLKNQVLPKILQTVENCNYKLTMKTDSFSYCYKSDNWQTLDLVETNNNNNNNNENATKEKQLEFLTQRFFGSKSHKWIPAPSIPKTGPYAGHQVAFYKLTDQKEAESFSANLTAKGFKNEIKETPQGHLPCITVDLNDSAPVFN